MTEMPVVSNLARTRRDLEQMARDLTNVLVSTTEPVMPDVGVGWFDPTTLILKMFDGRDWVGDYVDLTVTSLNIPDTTSANSFHVDTDGNTWWGCNVADWLVDHDNAAGYILKDGTARFSTLTVADTGMAFEDIYGDGSDGNVTISAPTTLTRDMFYNNLVVSDTLDTGGYRIFVLGTLSGSGTIRNNGNDGGDGGVGSGTQGAAGASAAGNSVPPGIAGATGGQGAYFYTNPGGSVGTAGGTTNKVVVLTTAADGGAGGAGGELSGISTAGGAGGAGGTSGTAILNQIRVLISAYLLSDFIGGVSNFNTANKSAGGGGGSLGYELNASNRNALGGSGGGSGSGGGFVWISARTITYTGVIESIGGDGGDGHDGNDYQDIPNHNTGGGGGGGGGAGMGGVIIVISSTATPTYTTDVSPGSPGVGGLGGASRGGGSEDGSPGLIGDTADDGTVITLLI